MRRLVAVFLLLTGCNLVPEDITVSAPGLEAACEEPAAGAALNMNLVMGAVERVFITTWIEDGCEWHGLHLRGDFPDGHLRIRFVAGDHGCEQSLETCLGASDDNCVVLPVAQAYEGNR